MTNTHEARQAIIREYGIEDSVRLPVVGALVDDLVEARVVAEQIHTALAEANVPRSEGVGEPLFSDAHRVRLLYQDRDEARAQVERMREEADRQLGRHLCYTSEDSRESFWRAVDTALAAAVPDPEEDSRV
jgi:hypothetical protein